MPEYPLRIIHKDAMTAFLVINSFEPLKLDWIDGYSQKRHGNCQVLLLPLPSKSHLDTFISICRSHPTVIDVLQITEKEFWNAPSNSM